MGLSVWVARRELGVGFGRGSTMRHLGPRGVLCRRRGAFYEPREEGGASESAFYRHAMEQDMKGGLTTLNWWEVQKNAERARSDASDRNTAIVRRARHAPVNYKANPVSWT